MKLNTRQVVLGGLAALLSSGLITPVLAQEAAWPSKQPLTLIVPFGAGSSPDTMARVVAEEAGKTLKQTIVIQNRPGASGNLGTDQIAKAKELTPEDLRKLAEKYLNPADAYLIRVDPTGE